MKQKGFTLIELLIIITIIAVISAIAFASYQTLMQKTRDSKRIGDIKGLSLELENYFIKYNKYPTPQTQAGNDCNSSNIDTFYTAIAEFRKDVPVDPKSKEKYCYIPVNNGGGYKLQAKLENCANSNINNCQPDTYNYIEQ